MSKLARILLWFGGIVVVICTYLWFFGVQTFCALEARRIGRQVPIVKSIPLELEDLSVSKVQGEKVSFLGAGFEVPWEDVDEKTTRIVGNWALIHFRSGNSIILCVGPPDGDIRAMSKNKTPDPQLFAAMYGPEVLRSDYAMHKAIFEATPSQITLSTPTNRAAGLASVILIKAIMPPTTDWAIYNIRSKDFKGFQLGNPARRPKKMCLELYADDVEIEVNIMQSESGRTPAITQAEINRIIQTAHKAARTQPVLNVNPA